ncbi:flagellar hook-associated protein FlgL [Paenibacillus cisolokensis]|uniref:Flagellar hook-associated protein FlgL n=1 Tax=Paenibacillus cisolokensis TaxID=1658519 RepID=A0ABQ4N3V5_9BACL|nr:flagellar hook-associated protein FlgL [Paenibacillus cisolokensis]GIQ62839.1 flagellar hook-associated protein FlgL [Paenibacillus cisolokensis]
MNDARNGDDAKHPVVKNLRNTNAGIIDWQNKLSTGQRIQKPSDDPVGIGYQMRYDTELNRSEEFLENARTGLGWLRTMDSLMQQATDVLKRARVLTQQASTGTVPEDARKQIAAEIRQLKEQMIAIGNSDYGGRYLFNGQKTDQMPYSLTNAANDPTDKGVYFLNVSPSVTVPVSITGEQIFGEAGSPDNVFQVLDDIATHLEDNDQDAILDDLARIDRSADRIAIAWAEIGARTNRFELVENRILDEQIGLKQLRSEVADVDMSEAIIELKLKENVLQAALSTGARIMQVSLVDFIR